MKKLSIGISLCLIVLLSIFLVPAYAWYIPPIRLVRDGAVYKTYSTYQECKVDLVDGDTIELLGNVIESDIVIDKNITINLQASGIKSSNIHIDADVSIDAWDNGIMVPTNNFDILFDISDNGSLSIYNGTIGYLNLPIEDCCKINLYKGKFMYVNENVKNSIILPSISYLASEEFVGYKDEIGYYNYTVDLEQSYVEALTTKSTLGVSYSYNNPTYSLANTISLDERYILANPNMIERQLTILKNKENTIEAYTTSQDVLDNYFGINEDLYLDSVTVEAFDGGYYLKNNDLYLGIKENILGYYSECEKVVADDKGCIITDIGYENIRLFTYEEIDYIIGSIGICLGNDSEVIERINTFGSKVEYGILLSGKDALKDEPLTKETAKVDNILALNSTGASMYYPLEAVDYATTYVARMYVTVDNDTYYFKAIETSLDSLIEEYDTKELDHKYSELLKAIKKKYIVD